MAPAAYEFNQFRVELLRRRLLREGQIVALTPKVFDALVLLIERRGSVVTKDEMLASLWPDAAVEENNLGQVISKLRAALGELPGDNAYIATIPSRGYRFVAETRVEQWPNPAQGDSGRAAIPPPAAAPEPLGSSSAGDTDRQVLGRRVFWITGVLLVVALGVTAAYFAVAGRSAGARDRVTSIAILPFRPLVPQNRDQALEFGLADILIGRLATLENVSVRSLGSVREYADTSTSPVEAGRDLGVDAVLEGHIHRSEQRLRITVRLVRVADERQLWSGQFDEDFRSVFDIQDSIAQRVAQQLAPELDKGAAGRINRRDTSNPGAYEAYLRGRFFMSLAQPQNAIRMFEDAVRLDPGFAAAHAGLADIVSRLPIATDGPSAEAMSRASSAAAQAIAIAPDLAEAHTALGWIAFYGNWNWAESEKQFTRAIQINPSDFSARVGLAHLLTNIGRDQEALRQIEAAMSLEPTSPLAGTLRAAFLHYARRSDEAREQLQKTLAVAPGFWIARQYSGQLHLRERKIAEALTEFESARRSGGRYGPTSVIAYSQAIAGRRDEAAAGLRELMNARDQAYVPPYYIALVHHGMGNEAMALDWLERAYTERDVRMVFLGVDPLWDTLRQNRRFKALLARMHFVG